VDSDLSFGRLLKRLRKAHGLSQQALAQQAYCALDTIKKIEQGLRRPSRQLAEQFADCLALSGDERAAFLAAARAVATHETAARRTTAPRRQATLPHQATPLIGRTAELSALAALFAEPTTRLVTITGPGGMGKTRLAIALAEQLLAAERFSDGVCFVPLSALDAAERAAEHQRASALRSAGDLARRRQVGSRAGHHAGDTRAASGVGQCVAAVL
jgi:transcriptional regulator with XRE-family HTH domain